MRYLMFIGFAISIVASVSVSKPLNSGPYRLDQKQSIEREISEALKDIEESRKMIRMTVTINDTTDDTPSGFLRDVEDIFSGMFSVLQNAHFPFSNSENTTSPINDTSRQDILTRTRDELKEDITMLRSHIANIQADFNDWVLSNEHQEIRSMLIGGLSAAFVVVVYNVFCKCCSRRSRFNHLSAFANDGFPSQDTESLLPTSKGSKRARHYPSNSDEDI